MKLKSSKSKASVSERALFARVSRALAKQGLYLRRQRSQKWINDTGYYFTFDDHNVLQQRHINLETLGREIEVLRDWEALAEPQ